MLVDVRLWALTFGGGLLGTEFNFQLELFSLSKIVGHSRRKFQVILGLL